MADWQLFLRKPLSQLSSYYIKCHLRTNFDQKPPFSE